MISRRSAVYRRLYGHRRTAQLAQVTEQVLVQLVEEIVEYQRVIARAFEERDRAIMELYSRDS